MQKIKIYLIGPHSWVKELSLNTDLYIISFNFSKKPSHKEIPNDI